MIGLLQRVSHAEVAIDGVRVAAIELGLMVLVGVEYVVIADAWNAHHPDGSTPKVAGQLMNLIPAPNRYGLPSVYELHAWAWQNNPDGNFADWNHHVTCQKQPLPPLS